MLMLRVVRYICSCFCGLASWKRASLVCGFLCSRFLTPYQYRRNNTSKFRFCVHFQQTLLLGYISLHLIADCSPSFDLQKMTAQLSRPPLKWSCIFFAPYWDMHTVWLCNAILKTSLLPLANSRNKIDGGETKKRRRNIFGLSI